MAKQSASTDLSKLDPNNLPEIQGFKEAQLKLVKENPYVAIEDNSTYEQAKKHRTALRTGRTTLQSQEKLVVKKINEFKNKVKDATAELIQITLPHEEKQQAEVSRYEEIKEQERLERERLEEERIQGHKDRIANFKSEWENRIEILVYENAVSLKSEFVKEIANLDLETFEEFETEMQTVMALVEDKMDSRIKYLNQQEEQRQEALRLQKEREKQERIQKIKDGIENYFYHWSNEISAMNIHDDFNKFYEEMNDVKLKNIEGFEERFEEKKKQLIALFESRVKILEQEKKQETERLALQKEREQIETEKRENLYIKRVNALDKIDYFSHKEQGENFKEEILEMDDDAFEVFVKESHDSILKGMEVDAEVVSDVVEEDKDFAFSGNIEFLTIDELRKKHPSFTEQELENIKNQMEESADKDFVFPDDLGSGPEEKYSQAKHLIEYLSLDQFAKQFVYELGCDTEDELETIYQDFLKKFESLKQRTIKKIQEYNKTLD